LIGLIVLIEHNISLSAIDWTPRLHRLLLILQEEVEGFTLRLAASFTNRRDQLVALINNYDLMLTVMSVSSAFNLIIDDDVADLD